MGIRISEMEEATTFGADDYVPIVTNGTNKKALGAKIKDFIAGFFVSKSGDTMTGDLNIDAAAPNLQIDTSSVTIDTTSNNHVSANTASGIEVRDSNDYYYGRLRTQATTAGAVTTYISARNKKTDGTAVVNSINVTVNKDGTMSYSITDPAAFRTTLGMGWTELAEFTALNETKNYSISGYTMIALVIFYKPDDRIYTLATTCGPISELLNSHMIACMNDGTARKCQIYFRNTNGKCENFSNISYAKLYGYN